MTKKSEGMTEQEVLEENTPKAMGVIDAVAAIMGVERATAITFVDTMWRASL